MHRDGGGRRRWWRWARSARGSRLLPTAAAIVGSVTLTACGGGGPDKTLEQVASWAASARLAAENRAAGATSARYTQNVLHATHAELLKNVQALRAALDSSKDSSRLSPQLRVRAKAAAGDTEEAVAAMVRLAEEQPDDIAALLVAGSRADEAGSEAQELADSAKKQ